MKRIEAYKEAARRCGFSEAEIEKKFDKIRMGGAALADFNLEIEPGHEETIIRQQINIINTIRDNQQNPSFQLEMERIRRKVQSNN